MPLPRSTKHVYGHLKDPLDYKRPAAHQLFRAGSYPTAASLSNFLPRTMDQGQTGRCFPAGTPVLMADFSERPIEEIGEGNEVLTHNGKRRRVTHRFTRQYDGQLFSLRVKGYCYPLTMTDEHPVGISRDGETIEWVPAKDVRPRDYVLLPGRTTPETDPLPNQVIDVAAYISEETLPCDNGRVRLLTARFTHAIPARIQIDEQFARLMGLFLAEGSFRKSSGERTGVAFSFARHETEYHSFIVSALAERFGVTAVVIETDDKPNETQIRAENATLARLFYELCGEHALRKYCPAVFFRSPRSVRLQLIRGWLDGDGSQDKIRMRPINGTPRTSVQTDGITSSERLHRDLWRLSLLSGLKPGASIRAQESHQNAPARALVFYSTDVLALFPDAQDEAERDGLSVGTRWQKYKRHELGFLCRVQSIEISQPDEPITVYNLEIDGEHTYVAGGMAVHNCVGYGKSGAIFTSGQGKLFLPSPSGIYTLARCVDRLPDPRDGSLESLIDIGSRPSQADRAIAEWGVQPFNEAIDGPEISDELLNAEPALADLRADSATMLIGSYALDETASDIEAQIARTISSGFAISFAIPDTDDSFENYAGGVLGGAVGRVYGGHELFCYGYEFTPEGRFYMDGLNSWGEYWGVVGGFRGGSAFVKRWVDVQAMRVYKKAA